MRGLWSGHRFDEILIETSEWPLHFGDHLLFDASSATLLFIAARRTHIANIHKWYCVKLGASKSSL